MDAQHSTRHFYSDLPSFSDFRQIGDLNRYQALPDDWTILISDVVDSTGAIERGEYKNVNLVGAATITVVMNMSGEVELPFVFAGDGGLIAVPPDLKQQASLELKRLQAASVSLVDLKLRVAAIPVADLRASGADIRVHKYKLSEGNDLAMFAGSGLMTADRWLKADPSSNGYALQANPEEDLPNLEGLSCRWEPLNSRNGTMLTVILQPVDVNDGKELMKISDTIGNILGGPVSDFAPAHKETLNFRYPPAALEFEIKAAARHSIKLKRIAWAYFTAFMQYFCERFDVKIGDYDGTRYRGELMTNTDYRKYDGTLRMVLDVSEQQCSDIVSFLEQEYLAGRLVYGSWQANRALMTCLLFSLAKHQHVHFIDGAGGGYAMAASDMKRRMKN